jgi:hypothetical protein
MVLHWHCIPAEDATLGTLPSAGEGILLRLPGYDECDRTVSFKDSLADHSESDSIEYPDPSSTPLLDKWNNPQGLDPSSHHPN